MSSIVIRDLFELICIFIDCSLFTPVEVSPNDRILRILKTRINNSVNNSPKKSMVLAWCSNPVPEQ